MSEGKSGCGCVGKGCAIMVVIAAIFIGYTFWSFQKAVAWARQHTADRSVEVPAENVTGDQYDALVKRMNAFKDADRDSGKTLELSAQDFNTLIARSPDWVLVRGKLHVSIENDHLGVMGSIPLTYMPKLHDQYLNGDIFFTPSMDNKVLHLSIDSMQLKGAKLPREDVKTMADYIRPYVTNTLLADPVMGSVLIKAKTLKITGNTLVLTRG